MVELVKNFEDLNSAYCREIVYKIEEIEGAYRVRAGRYDQNVKKEQAEEILSWLKHQSAIEIVSSISDDMFFA